MFLRGPFLQGPFLEGAVTGSVFTGVAGATGTFKPLVSFHGGLPEILADAGDPLLVSAGDPLLFDSITFGATATIHGAIGARFTGVASASGAIRGAAGARFQGTCGATGSIFASAAALFAGVCEATAGIIGATAWDLMLSEDNSPIGYFAELEPWVLADRS